MSRLRDIVSVVAWAPVACALITVGIGCDGNKPQAQTETKAEVTPSKQPAVAKPKINPHESMSAKAVEQGMIPTQPGSFDLHLGDEVMHLPLLPPGKNTARATDGRKPLLSVSATGKSGYPSIIVEMTGWRPDALRYPIELTSTKKQNFRFVYRASEHGALATKLEETLRGENKVTLESYKDGVLKGTFSGTVKPRDKAPGAPLKVSGSFNATLVLRNVEANPEEPAATPAAAKPKAP